MLVNEHYLDHSLLDVIPSALSAVERRRFLKEVSEKAPLRGMQLLSMAGISTQIDKIGKVELDALQRWVWSQRLVSPYGPSELEAERARFNAEYGDQVGAFLWNALDKRGMVHCGPVCKQVGIDIAMLIACILIAKHPSLRWKLANIKHPQVYKHPCLVGFHRREVFAPTVCPETWCASIEMEPAKSYIWDRLAYMDELVIERGSFVRLIS